ncbi:acyltransferase-domain-containing protein [Geopyxis carbonaria]|nr:acyltransferase-domain-containing protein [Geopyxis carbonaria]
MPLSPHPAGNVRYGGFVQFVRICTSTIYFLGCSLIIGSPLYFINRPRYYAYMARTKQYFGVVVITITQWWSPTVIRVTGSRAVRDQMTQTPDGRLLCDFPARMILIANHQLYSDWLYLWWVAYSARMHGHLYIILKESLKYIPLLGIGMQFYGFIFLARKWDQDKPRFIHRLSQLASSRSNNPMWLLIFPEGTNLSDNGRNSSTKYATKIGISDLQHQLLPRSTGLKFCLQQLGNSVDWVYDCTIAYEGIPRGKFGQDYFTLYSTYFQGRPPKSVNMYWRRFSVKSIPIDDATKFDLWLRERWIEKDRLLEYYIVNGVFPAEVDSHQEPTGLQVEQTSVIETEVKLASRFEIIEIFSILVFVSPSIFTSFHHLSSTNTYSSLFK